MATLPQDIMMVILSKLPVKSLCRFRCVSKSFIALIAEPLFIKMHLSQTPTKKFLVYCCGDLLSIDYEKACNNGEIVEEKLHLPNDSDHHVLSYAEIYNSCNGLVLLRLQAAETDTSSMYIYNPSIREYKQILGTQTQCCSHYETYGIGYSQPHNDYKVVKVCSCENVHIFSLKNNSWKKIGRDKASYTVFGDFEGVFLNGAIHWLFYEDWYSTMPKLVAFDLTEEKFKILPLPTNVSEHFAATRFSSFISVIGGCLSVAVVNGMRIDRFWIMKEYGRPESWSTITCSIVHSFLELCYLDNNERILLDSNENDLYLKYEKIYKKLRYESFSYFFRCHPQVYEESLVSPNYYNNIDDDEVLEILPPSQIRRSPKISASSLGLKIKKLWCCAGGV